MKIRHIGSRGIMVTYEDLLYTDFACTSNVYLINEPGEMVMCDTFLGPRSMEETFRKLMLEPGEVTRVINTHSDWDHIWGNSFFNNADLICHENYTDLVVHPGTEDFEELARYARGNVTIASPDLTFNSRVYFERLGLTVFYTPGHSADSISIYDEKDRILIAGDNCEKPVPSYVRAFFLEDHLKTLVNYLELDFQFIIPGHGEIMTREDLMENIRYLEDLIEGDPDVLKGYEEGLSRMNHLTNLMYMDNSIQ